MIFQQMILENFLCRLLVLWQVQWRGAGRLFPTREWPMISGLEHVSQKGIECQGCIIPDEDVRRGHRAMRLDGSARMKSQVRRVQLVTELILQQKYIHTYIHTYIHDIHIHTILYLSLIYPVILSYVLLLLLTKIDPFYLCSYLCL